MVIHATYSFHTDETDVFSFPGIDGTDKVSINEVQRNMKPVKLSRFSTF